jgi:molecular chaperone GrpE
MGAQHDLPDSEQHETENDSSDIGEESATDGTVAGAGEPGEEADPVLAELQARADENWDKYLRAAAELENVRKRASRDVENAHKFALERFCTELLAVKDSLEAGLAVDDGSDVTSLLEGKAATLKQLTATMERFGVVELSPEGEPFNPEEHEAMTVQPSSAVEPGSVLTVFQKGYALNGRLLRPARVVVASEPATGEGNAGG